ncbi:hypothetical protein, partial [Altibacter sp.]|uniref:hypothetical protein n=1 Tax=Altibacter sp. TaxID=2024823 RepID=UPI00258F2BC2
MRKRIIKISKNKIYFSNNDFLELVQTNFPKDSLTFKQHLDIYLEVELSNYNREQRSLELVITDYSPKETHYFNDQELKKPIHKLIFKELEWTRLQSLLSFYRAKLPELIPDAFRKPTRSNFDDNQNEELNKSKVTKPNDGIDYITKLTKSRIVNDVHEFNFEALFKEAQFQLGFVSIIKTLTFYHEPIEFKIFNDAIIPQYDYIKGYFSNYFNSKRFEVNAKIEIRAGEIFSTDSRSKEIELINNELISTINKDRILNITKIKEDKDDGKSSFLMHEILAKIENPNNIFENKDQDIIDSILELKTPRNIDQLRYLARKKHEKSQKIRFTLSPLFGFIFFIS